MGEMGPAERDHGNFLSLTRGRSFFLLSPGQRPGLLLPAYGRRACAVHHGYSLRARCAFAPESHRRPIAERLMQAPLGVNSIHAAMPSPAALPSVRECRFRTGGLERRGSCDRGDRGSRLLIGAHDGSFRLVMTSGVSKTCSANRGCDQPASRRLTGSVGRYGQRCPALESLT
jgi:hypothetical protein